MGFKLNHKYNRYVIVTFLLTLLAILIRTVLLAKYFDADAGYYIRGSKFPIIYIAFMFISLAVFVSSAFVLKTSHLHFSLNQKLAYTAFTRSFAAFVLILYFVVYVLTGEVKLDFRFVCNVMSLPSAVYFIYPIFANKPSKKLCAFLCFFPIIWATLNLAAVYFDSAVAINNPLKISEQLAFMSVMIYFLYECRVYLKKPIPKAHCIASMAAILFTATAGITGIIMYGFKIVSSSYIMYDLILTALCLYIASQFIANRVK